MIAAAASGLMMVLTQDMTAGGFGRGFCYFAVLIWLSRAADDYFDYEKDDRKWIARHRLLVLTIVLAVVFVGSSVCLFGWRGLLAAALVAYGWMMERWNVLTLLSVCVSTACYLFAGYGTEVFGKTAVIVFLPLTIVLEVVFYWYKRSRKHDRNKRQSTM